MQKKRSMPTKLVVAALIFMTLVSTAVVVAKSCHNEQVPVVAAATVVHASHGDHVHTPPVNSGYAPFAANGVSAQGVLNSGLIPGICTGIFFLVLILGSRFLAKNLSNTFRNKINVLNSVVTFKRPKFLPNLTLSLPQLGLYRI